MHKLQGAVYKKTDTLNMNILYYSGQEIQGDITSCK